MVLKVPETLDTVYAELRDAVANAGLRNVEPIPAPLYSPEAAVYFFPQTSKSIGSWIAISVFALSSDGVQRSIEDEVDLCFRTLQCRSSFPLRTQ